MPIGPLSRTGRRCAAPTGIFHTLPPDPVRSWGGVGHTTNNMKNKIIAGVIAILSVTGVQAQDEPGTSAMDKAWVLMNTEMLNMELDLNDRQKEDVRAIDQRYEKKHDEMMAVVPKPTDKKISENVEGLMKERDKALRGTLNDDQYAKWEKKRHKGTSDLQEKEKDNLKK